VLDSRAPAWCLYRGKLPGPLEDAAPWMVRLVPGLTDALLLKMWNRSWGIVLASPLPSRELRRHLRKFLRVATEGRRTLVFRYYDPRVLCVFLAAPLRRRGLTPPLPRSRRIGRAAS
jgi:hypothetical protein